MGGVDEVVFAKDLDYWLSIHRDLGILRREAQAPGLHDIAMDIGIMMGRISGRFLHNMEASFIARARKNGRTMNVLHTIFGIDGGLSHLGIEGVRGWDIEDPDRVEFRRGDKRFQFEHLRYGERADMWRVKGRRR